ncbi:thiamine phosphate synthase [Halalkalibaculum sp. DA384]|uniref:thiamine phosphate synthase n=1 Tax=Halalkalibaculum sp. DA384 TaxID=3373606 RepID=UPI0037541A9E
MPFRYYLITDRKKCAPRPLAEVVEKACRNGIKAVQLREKDLSGRALFECAEKLREITSRWNAQLFVNDRADIALAVGADGVHCRETSISPADIKELDSSLIIGTSVHSVESAVRAESCGADFLLFGPVFYTASKAEYGAPQGLDKLRHVSQIVSIPVYAVGGLTTGRAPGCLKAGAYGVAGISSIMGAKDVSAKVQEWEQLLSTL